MLNKSSLFSRSGFSLIEAMVAAGLVAVIGAGTTSLILNTNKQQKGIQAKDQQREVTANVRYLLTNQAACKFTMDSSSDGNAFPANKTNPPLDFIVKDSAGNPQLKTDDPDKTNLLKVSSITVSDFAPTAGSAGQGTINLKVNLEKIDTGNTGNKNLAPDLIKLRVTYDTSTFVISACEAIGNSTDSLWTRSSVNLSDIYYTAGKVGIGTTTPLETLHVEGAIRAAAGPTNGYKFTPDPGGGYGDVASITYEVLAGEATALKIQVRNDQEQPGNVGDELQLRAVGGIKMYTGTVNDEFTERMRVNSAGNVGIGSTNPTARLTIGNGYIVTQGVPGSDTIGYASYPDRYPVLAVNAEHGAGPKDIISLGHAPTGAATASNPYSTLDMFTKISSWSRNPTAGAVDTSNYIAIGENNLSYTPGGFLIQGSVGIGTNAPTQQLTTTGNALIGSGAYPALFIRDTSWWIGTLQAANTSWPDSDSFVFSSPTGRPFVFQSGASGQVQGTPRMYIDTNNGNVGIGNTSPISRLQVAGGVRAAKGDPGNDNADVGFSFDSDGDTGLFAIGGNVVQQSDIIIKSDGAEKIRFATTGNVGIGITTPVYKLQVDGDIGANSVVYSSDERLKQNLRPLKNSLEHIVQLRTLIFNWNELGAKSRGLDDKKDHLGLIAQDVEKYFPQAVVTQSDQFKSVDYSVMVVPIIQALKEQKEINQRLEARLQVVEAALQKALEHNVPYSP